MRSRYVDRGVAISRSRVAQDLSWWRCLAWAAVHRYVKMCCLGGGSYSDRVSVYWNRCARPIDILLTYISFNITSMTLQLHVDILSVEVGISAILPFSCFLVHHAENPRLMRWEKIEYAESVVQLRALPASRYQLATSTTVTDSKSWEEFWSNCWLLQNYRMPLRFSNWRLLLCNELRDAGWNMYEANQK